MTHWFTSPTVAVIQGDAWYSRTPPFNPAFQYPEYPFKSDVSQGAGNPAYDGVRAALIKLGLDVEHLGTQDWNPLGSIIEPGDFVVLKPNLIRESHGIFADQWEQVVTHGSVVRAVLDYVFIALQGRGRVLVADGPQTDSDFDAISSRLGLDRVVQFYAEHGLDVRLVDLRRDRWFQKGDVIYRRIPLPGDPSGYTTIDLGETSEFASYRLNGRFYGADYDMAETSSFHSNGHNSYILCRSVIDADVIINLPKMKTHKKTGVTLSLKNIVGINGYRNCLPHHTVGTPDQGGDEFPTTDAAHKVQSQALTWFREVLVARGGTGEAWARAVKRVGRLAFGGTDVAVRSGNWYGNDTAWRMVLDLNKALFHFEGDGEPRRKPLRYLAIVDGIVAGEGNGPTSPDVVKAGILVAGFNPVAVDTVCATLMGFDFRKLPMLARAWEKFPHPLVSFDAQDVVSRSNRAEWDCDLQNLEQCLHLGFQPHLGWKGHIERSAG
jgi:uncharacterized protein (DUF362 family)